MKIRGIVVALILTVVGCAPTDTRSESSPATASTSASRTETTDDGTIAIASEIPFAEYSRISANIKRECHLPKKLSDFIRIYAKSYRVPVKQMPSVSASDPGKVLVIEIVDSVSQGNAFFGHRKFTRIAGKLYQDGEAIGSFEASRYSGGGAFAGFKSSCAVLGRTVKALGRDVANWLRAPAMNSVLGDMR